jgi:hypothetical protein
MIGVIWDPAIVSIPTLLSTIQEVTEPQESGGSDSAAFVRADQHSSGSADSSCSGRLVLVEAQEGARREQPKEAASKGACCPRV